MPGFCIADVYDLLGNLTRSHYHGTLEITFRDGLVVHVKESQTIIAGGTSVVFVAKSPDQGAKK